MQVRSICHCALTLCCNVYTYSAIKTGPCPESIPRMHFITTLLSRNDTNRHNTTITFGNPALLRSTFLVFNSCMSQLVWPLPSPPGDPHWCRTEPFSPRLALYASYVTMCSIPLPLQSPPASITPLVHEVLRSPKSRRSLRSPYPETAGKELERRCPVNGGGIASIGVLVLFWCTRRRRASVSGSGVEAHRGTPFTCVHSLTPSLRGSHSPSPTTLGCGGSSSLIPTTVSFFHRDGLRFHPGVVKPPF